LPEQLNFFEFLRQANMQRAFPTESLEQRFGLCQRGTCDYVPIKDTPPFIYDITFVQHATSSLPVTNLSQTKMKLVG
jgi:hypothetical protein